MKYSKNFERDYQFYLICLEKQWFDFCGKEISVPEYRKNGVDAKTAFWNFDSKGKILETYEPKLLHELLKVKAGVNWQIKAWAEDIKGSSFWINELKKEYECPQWVWDAVKNQGIKILKRKLYGN